MDTIPLSNLVPNWQGHYIPEAYSALEKGLNNRRARHLFDRYLVFSFVSDLDYDGILDRIYFDAGFKMPEEAAIVCSRVVKQRMLQARIRYGSQTDHWHRTPFVDIPLERTHPRVSLLAAKEINDGTGWNRILVYAGVLEMTPGNPLTVADLNALGHTHAVIWYLGQESAL
jgi:hypothetical protein